MFSWPYNKKLNFIIQEIQSMATTLAQLDAAVAANTAAVNTVVSDVAALLAKIAANPAAPDFTAEVNALSASTSALSAADVTAEGVISPTAS